MIIAQLGRHVVPSYVRIGVVATTGVRAEACACLAGRGISAGRFEARKKSIYCKGFIGRFDQKSSPEHQ